MWEGPDGLRAETHSSAQVPGNESSASARLFIPTPPQPAPGTVEYSLVPAEERPPARQGPEPNLGPLVDPLSPPAPAPAPAAQQAPQKPAADPAYIDDSLFIDSIEKLREDRARTEAAQAAEEKQRADAAKAAAAARQEEERRLAAARDAAAAAQPVPPPEPPAEVIVHMPEETEDPQGPWVNPIAEAPKPSPAPPPDVSVRVPEEAGEPAGPWVDPIAAAPKPSPEPKPVDHVAVITPKPSPEPKAVDRVAAIGSANVITELEKGKYYVQLGAYRSAASIESALLKLDPGYPLKVQPTGSADNPLYRLLVGPVNLGESGALVQRFKGSGYRDAYVRSN
jgi:hypothetical protein